MGRDSTQSKCLSMALLVVSLSEDWDWSLTERDLFAMLCISECIFVVCKKSISLSGTMRIFCKRFHLYSVYFDKRHRGVSWLVIRSLTASYTLVFADPEGSFCALDIAIRGNFSLHWDLCVQRQSGVGGIFSACRAVFDVWLERRL